MIKNPYEFEKRSFVLDKKDTTISMERIYWAVLDQLAKKHRWHRRGLVHHLLAVRPKEYRSRAGWLRFYVSGYAYTFLTRPAEIHNPPKSRMEWDGVQAVFRFPTRVSRYE